MAVAYSEIRRQLIAWEKRGDNESLAWLTHLLHSLGTEESWRFVGPMKTYFEGNEIMRRILNAQSGQLKLKIDWDIPFPTPKNPKFTFIDLFAGIGGFRLAFQNLGGKCVFSSEWNEFSKRTYEANFGEVPFGDITKIDESTIPDHDILLGGFPCQPFSLAGVSKKNSLGRKHGFEDETQGTLFFDVVRILKSKRPKAFILENVKNLVSHDKGNTFRVIKGVLEELEYNVHPLVMDGKSFVPQHRERIFLVGFDNRHFHGQEEFEFPSLAEDGPKIKEILQEDVDPKYTLTDHLWKYLQDYSAKHRAKGNGFGFGMTKLDGISRTLSARYYKDGSEILIPQGLKNPRRLTPRECARLLGYPDTFRIPVSDMQAYRQFGNSVVVPLVKAIGENLVKELLMFPDVNVSNIARFHEVV
jgi:DNA (cytosine-5)-methyltransferase 1